MEKILVNKTCTQCSKHFDIMQGDRDFYTKISPTFWWKKYQIPDPTLCPDCRRQRRLARLNEIQLYKNVCHGCGTYMVSRFHPESWYKNYCNKCWASDSWDACDFWRDIDFSRSFFEQIHELQQEVPFQNLIGALSNIENNAVYTNHTADIKDSYMVSESDNIENCYYGSNIRESHTLFDCVYCSGSEHAYDCRNCANIYKGFFISYCEDCSNSYFLHDCQWCSFCIACVWLSNQEYYVCNKKVSPDEFREIEKILFTPKWKDLMNEKYQKMISEYELWDCVKFSENCSWKSIYNSSNCYNCINTIFSQDCRYCNTINNSEDLVDVSSYGSNSHLMYEWLGVGRYSHNVLFSSIIGRWEYIYYCIDTKKSQHCFGCVNMKGAKYCILNKQYTKKEYERLIPKIIEHMKETGEWGEFFPVSLSPFWYNETLAHEYFPLDMKEVLEKWWNWSDYEAPFPKVEKIIKASTLPENIEDIPDDILNWAIECEATKKPFRIIKQELDFYRKHGLPIPRRHPDKRRIDRIT